MFNNNELNMYLIDNNKWVNDNILYKFIDHLKKYDNITKIKFGIISIEKNGKIYIQRWWKDVNKSNVYCFFVNLYSKHWSLLSNICYNDQFVYYDSLYSHIPKELLTQKNWYPQILKDILSTKIIFYNNNTPKQRNSNDCGVYVIFIVLALLSNESFSMIISREKFKKLLVIIFNNDIIYKKFCIKKLNLIENNLLT